MWLQEGSVIMHVTAFVAHVSIGQHRTWVIPSSNFLGHGDGQVNSN